MLERIEHIAVLPDQQSEELLRLGCPELAETFGEYHGRKQAALNLLPPVGGAVTRASVDNFWVMVADQGPTAG